MIFCKIEKGGPYRVIRTGYQPIRLQESRSVSVAINNKLEYPGKIQAHDQPAISQILQCSPIAQWNCKLDIKFLIDLDNIYNKLSSDYSLNTGCLKKLYTKLFKRNSKLITLIQNMKLCFGSAQSNLNF